MKLSEYVPQLPYLNEKLTEVNRKINQLDLLKAAGETGGTPTLGIDGVVNPMVRNNMTHRNQLIRDVQTIVMTVEEIRGPLNHITSEVFRRGLDFQAKVENPDPIQKQKLEDIRTSCNVFGQSLEEVLRQFHHDVISLDDGFLHLSKQYKDLGNGKVSSRLLEIRRINPSVIEFDLDENGLPKNLHFICPIHREEVRSEVGTCLDTNCDLKCVPVMFRMRHRTKDIYLLDSEVIHLSKFSPSETYGWSPVLTIFEKAMTLVGMDRKLFNYFYQRRMPASMLLVTTDDPESLRREREHIVAQTRADPNYVPMIAVSSRNQRGKVDLVRLFHTLQEMDYLPVRQEIRERVAAIWGVSPAWQGAPEAFGGLSSQTQQLTVMSRVVESDQRLFMEAVFPHLLECLAITDFNIILPQPEEKAENTKLAFAMQKVNIASQFAKLGFNIRLKEQNADVTEAEFVVTGEPVETAKLVAEQAALNIESKKKELDQSDVDNIKPDSGRKFEGRTGGVTPNSADKAPNEERDLDSYAEARSGDIIQTSKSWIDDLVEKGFTHPLIKQVSPDFTKMWFIQDNTDYIAYLNSEGISMIEKGTFNPIIQTPKTTEHHEKPVESDDDE